MPVFNGGTVERKAPIFWEYAGGKAMRQGNWKLVKRNGGEWELYDLKADPTELNDQRISQTAILKKMSMAYAEWEKEVPLVED